MDNSAIRTYNTARHPHAPLPQNFAVCVTCGRPLSYSLTGGICHSPFCPQNMPRPTVPR